MHSDSYQNQSHQSHMTSPLSTPAAPDAIDPALARTLQRFAQLDAATATPQLDYVQRRRLLSELQARLLRSPLPGIAHVDHFVAAEGREICVRSYQKRSNPSGQTLVWLHGGGWMVGDLNTHDDLCEHLVQFTGHTVLSVHYRRAPESPFPAALDDVRAVLQWLHRMRGLLPFAGDTVLLGGDSAGAHLALACAVQHAAAAATAATTPPADAPAIPQLRGLLLFYPPIAPQQDHPSMQAFSEGFGLTRSAMAHYWQALGGVEGPAAALRLPASCSAALPLLPPTVVCTASHDILRDEGEAFAAQLQASGVPSQLLRAPGMVHGFARMLAASPAARQQVEQACTALLALLRRSTL